MSAQKWKPSSALRAVLGTLGFSVLAGVLVAVLVTPAIAVAGATVNNTVGIFDSLPDFIEIDSLPEQNRIFANSNGEQVQIATMFDQNREEVAWDQVSDFAKDAAVSGEDRRFFEHGGVDLAGIVRAAVKNVAAGGISEGASTITQQYVKNTFIQAALELPTEEEQQAAYDAAIDDTFDRKLKEMKLAISLEKRYTKQEVLLAYLNIANFGGTTYGIEAAAQRYYNTTALNLTAAQAASLIATVQSPTAMRLDNEANWERNTARRNVILNGMLNDGKITEAQHAEAIAVVEDFSTITLTEPSNGCRVANDYTRYFCDYITNLVKDMPALGGNATERAAAWKHGGYDVYTTLDMGLQQVAQDAVWAQAPNDATRLNLGSVAVSVEVNTGRILTMAQNKVYDNTGEGDFTTTAVNFATDRAYGGSSGFQPGSTYKIFTLLNWLQNGHGINETVNGSARTVAQRTFLDTCYPEQGDHPWSAAPAYQFKNDDARGGRMSVATATQFSVNGAFISMAQQLDLCGIKNTAASLGVHRADGADLKTNPSSVLGINEIAPLTMAGAYAGIANGGIYCAPIAVDRIVGPNDTELVGQPQDCTRQLEANVAATAAVAMERVITAGTGTASNPRDGVEYIGKTGTTDSSTQTWIVGSSTRVATAVWVGNISGSYAIRSYYNTLRVPGSVIRHNIFRTLALAVDANPTYRGTDFPEPSDTLMTGTGITIPEISGQTEDAATAVLEGSGFTVIDGGTVDSTSPEGRAVSTNPPTGTLVPRGSEVTLYTSNGSEGVMPNLVGLDGDDAIDALEEAGFTNIKEECGEIGEDDDTEDAVLTTSPGSGASLSFSDRIIVTTGQKEC